MSKVLVIPPRRMRVEHPLFLPPHFLSKLEKGLLHASTIGTCVTIYVEAETTECTCGEYELRWNV